MISNLQTTPKGEEKRSYLKRSFLNNTLWSIWVRRLLIARLVSLRAFSSLQRGPLKNPSHIGKQGNISQLGGDFILGPGMPFQHPSQFTLLNEVVRCDVLIYV